MTENEQIEEMARDLCEHYYDGRCYLDKKECDCKCPERRDARYLYSKGYRKVERGEWIVTETERAWNNAEIPMKRSCDKCGLQRNIETQVGWNFCPECGADMRGEKDERR